jgi:hypothetical protein
MPDWFRAMGPGYQTRINPVLRAFVHARMAANVESAKDFRRPELSLEGRVLWWEFRAAEAESQRRFWERVDSSRGGDRGGVGNTGFHSPWCRMMVGWALTT